MGDHLATTDMGRKLGAVPLSAELDPHLTQCGLSRGLPPYQVASWFSQPFGHSRHGRKGGMAFGPFRGRSGSPSTQCRLGRHQPM